MSKLRSFQDSKIFKISNFIEFGQGWLAMFWDVHGMVCLWAGLAISNFSRLHFKISKFSTFQNLADLAMGLVLHRIVWLWGGLANLCAGHGRG
jgi:hypothetical protein